jgi:hypothetical protein
VKKSTLAGMIMSAFAGAVQAPLPISPLAEVLARHKGGKGNSVHHRYRKPNKWDVMRTCGNTALCRNRTTGEVAMKNVKLGPWAEREREINLMFKQQRQLEALNV